MVKPPLLDRIPTLNHAVRYLEIFIPLSLLKIVDFDTYIYIYIPVYVHEDC
jgi:hypothetical protein